MARQTITGIWANAATSDKIAAPTTTKLNAGWAAEKPSFRIFNWFWQKITNMIQNAEKYGIMEWSAETLYPLYGLTLAPATGIVYKSKQANNLNHAVTDTAWWEVAIVSKAYVDGSFLKDTNGYQILPSGIIMQWGSFITSATSTDVLFPMSFLNAVASVTFGEECENSTGGHSQIGGIYNRSQSKTGFKYSSQSGIQVLWHAIGY